MLKKMLLALLLLQPTLSLAQTYNAGSLQVMTPDRVGTATLGALNAAATVDAQGRQGIGAYIDTANLDAVVTPECSPDGTVWFATEFVSVAGAVASTLTFSGGADSQFHGITLLPGCQKARARVSTYTSGTASGRVVATASAGLFVRAIPVGTFTMSGSVTQGTSPWVVGDGGGALTVDNAGTFAVQATQAGTWTVTGAGGTFPVTDSGGSLTVDGPLTDTELRATPVPISGTVTTGGLTDTQLRATPVPISGTVTADAGTNLNTSALALEAGGNLASIATDAGTLAGTVAGSEVQVDVLNIARTAGSAVLGADAGVPILAHNLGSGTWTNLAATSGNLNVFHVGSSSTQPVSGTVTANANITQYLGTAASVSNAVHTRRALSANTDVVWTSASAIFSTSFVPSAGYDTGTIEIVCNGTITGGQVTFAGSSGIATNNWIRGVRRGNGNNTDATIGSQSAPLATGCSEHWQFNLAGYSSFGPFLTTVITGAGTVTVRVTLGTGPAAHVHATVDPRHLTAIQCTISSTATTSTLVTGCSAPGAGLSIYITGLSWSSSIISTTADFMRIQSGTGGACGTSTDILYNGFGLAFTTTTYPIGTPIKVPANEEVCFVHAGAGTRLVNIDGFIAP